MKKYFYLFGFLTLAYGITFTVSSCRKKAPTTAIITVRDTGNALVPNAQVILYGTSTTKPIKPVVRRDTLYTNYAGEAIFNYDEIYQLGMAGVAVLDIYVEKDDMTGMGLINIEEEKENKATVFIEP